MRIGILGGGQLGKMLALSGYPLGLSFSFFDPDINCCSCELAPTMHASFTAQDALTQFAQSVDIITYENENIPVASIELLQQFKPIFPSVKAIEIAQDRLLEKECLQKLGIPTTPFLAVNTRTDLEDAAQQLNYPFIVKTRRHGYDGKGQVMIRSTDTLSLVSAELLQQGCIAEAWVNYRREFSVIAVRAVSGETRFYDLCENKHENGILAVTKNKENDQALASVQSNVIKLLDAFEYHGVLTVEFFEDQTGNYLVNEIAPRVHNSGHWTIEGARTSQFQNHLRAGIGFPLGDVTSEYNTEMRNIIGVLPDVLGVLQQPYTYAHFYGKSEKPGRKLGHLTKIISRR